MSLKRRQDRYFLFLLPSLIGVVVFVLAPFLLTFLWSFMDSQRESWVALANYREVLENSAMRLALTNSGRFIIVAIPLQLSLSLLLAILLKHAGSLSVFFEFIFLLPLVIPVASLVMLGQVFFAKQGLLNSVLVQWGYQPQNWLNSSLTFWVLVIFYLWRNLGMTIVLWRVALNKLDPFLDEAAQVAGANTYQRFYFVILPQLLPAFFIITVISVLNTFKVFREAFLLAGHYPHESIYMLQHILNNWFMALDMQKLSAAAVLLALFLFALIYLLKCQLRRSPYAN